MRDTGDKPRLTRDAVVEAALEVAYRRGLDGLTIRRLAQELDVSPMAIYWHVRNKDELLDAMGDRAYRSLRITADPAQPWDAQLRTLLQDWLRMIERFPGVAAIVVPRALYAESGRELLERTLGLLREAGFGTREAAQLARQGVRTVMSLATEPLFAGVETEPQRRAHLLADYEKARTALDPGRYPQILAAWDDLGDTTARADFIRLGIDTYIHGVVSMAREHATARE